jgi:hypothetical protein
MKEDFYRIVFPSESSYIESKHGNKDNRLYPGHCWLLAACDWAKEKAVKQLALTDDAPILFGQELVSKIGKPSFIGDSMSPAQLKGYLELFQEIIEWLALKEDNGALIFDCYPIHLLNNDNDIFLSMLVSSVKNIRRWGLFEKWGIQEAQLDNPLFKYIDLIDQCLNESQMNNVEEGDGD